MDHDHLVSVFTTTSSTEAELVKNRISEEGMRCMLDNEHQAGLAGILPINVLVVSSHEVRARLLVSKYQKECEQHAEEELTTEDAIETVQL